MIRTYFCYFAKRNCSSDCKCNAAKTDNTVRRDIIYREVFKGDKQKDLADAITTTIGLEVVEAIGDAAETKPKRVRKPKAETPAAEPVEKKPGRKKKS
jgi:hypothetical protein